MIERKLGEGGSAVVFRSLLNKDLFSRVKRIESIMLAAAGSIIGLLVTVLMKMG